MRSSPEKITELNYEEIFVFGSNESGDHAGGAALLALDKFGAVQGVKFGMQGRSFAIPTVAQAFTRVLTIDEIKKYVDWFISATQIPENLDKKFLVTEIGCGIAGYTPEQIAPLFKKCLPLENVFLPARFIAVLEAVK